MYTAQDVAELRKITGAGMMDCKKALEECKGNMEEAKTYLRKKGIAAADKKSKQNSIGRRCRFLYSYGRQNWCIS